MFKLGTEVTETATTRIGTLTQMQVQQNRSYWYLFQPYGRNPENGQPLKAIWIVPDRIRGGIEISDPDLQLDVLGAQVEDMASGFRGMATAVTLHISGCIHVNVQPAGVQSKSGQVIDDCGFDIRRLKGDAIKPMTEEARAADQQQKPSPSDGPKFCIH